MILLLLQKWLSLRERMDPHAKLASVESEIARIRSGDDSRRGELLHQYTPFVAKTAARFCKRYIHPESDDEFSIALSAFNEAIDAFNEAAGRSFLSFAESVIRRRLIDYVRKEQKHRRHIPQSALAMEDEDGESFDPVERGAALDRYRLDRDNEERKLEIELLSAELAKFGITFADLVEGSPKHEDTRKSFIGIGAMIGCDDRLYGPLLAKRALPLKELAERASVSRKTLERGRKYIIAVALIYRGAYPHLRSFASLPGYDASSRADAGTYQEERGRRA